MSISDTSLEDRPTTITRFDDESGWSIAGDFDTFGRAWACVRRSATIWRARSTSVPGSKYMTIDERPGTDCEVIVSRKATPWSRSASSGTVISCSTS